MKLCCCLYMYQSCQTTVCIAAQTPLEATLTEEESRRNSRRMDLMYVSSSNPVTPDIFYLADQNRDLDAQARALAAQPLNAEITGLLHPTPMGCDRLLQDLIQTFYACMMCFNLLSGQLSVYALSFTSAASSCCSCILNSAG